jgi:hypothetical protein
LGEGGQWFACANRVNMQRLNKAVESRKF